MKITYRGMALLSCLAVTTFASGAYAAQRSQTNGAVPVYHPSTLTLTDQKGDANGINGQGFGDTYSHPTPVQHDSGDLLKVQ